MALRLTDPSPSSAPSPVLPGADLPGPADRARAALRTGDHAGYRACAAEALAVEDPHRRYVARRSVIEAGLEAASAAPAGSVATTYASTAAVALDVLAPAPAEPTLLNLAGVALYEIGGLRGADALFRAAVRLDPALAHVKRNIREIKRRRKGGVQVMLPPAVAREIAPLERRARELAGRAQPGHAGTIALCMIVRDEERVLDRCLRSARGAVDQLIVVDTGSTDRTVEIARAHGATVLEHAWADDFAAARNAGLDAATSDWILHLDADEELAREDLVLLRDLTRRDWREGYALQLHNKVGTEIDSSIVVSEAIRLFRNRPQHRFEGRVHEHVGGSMPADATERVESAPVRIHHDGYLKRTRDAKDKSRRNLELLERQLAEETPTAFLHYNLGSEYASAGDGARAIEHFARSWDMLLADPDRGLRPFTPSVAMRYAGVLRLAGHLDRGEEIARQALELFPDFTDLALEQARIAACRGRLETAEALLRRCLEQGDAPSRFLHTVGAGSFVAASELASVLLARGRTAEAERLALDTLAGHPDILEAVEPAVRAMLTRGAEPAAAVAAVLERVGTATPEVRFALAATLHGAGAAVAAEEQLRALLDAEPGNDAARVALTEALLSQSRFAEAAAVAAEVDGSSMWAPKAAVSQGFAALAAGDRAGADDALARAARTGTPDHERALLEAWRAAVAGTRVAAPPAAAFPLLLTFLEALLRVQDFDAFGALLPVAERIAGVPSRTRREALARLYVRRGFLDSAADEWAAACQETGPDAAALLGLAEVEAARGNLADARVFAEGALELDPADGAAAAAMLDRLAGA